MFSPDGQVIVTNDGATILEKMEVNKFFRPNFFELIDSSPNRKASS